MQKYLSITQQRRAVVREALSWLGTPYHHQGAVKGAGVDCAMLLVQVYHCCGLIPAIDPRPYPHDWHLHRSAERYLQWLDAYARELPDAATAQAGDVLLWRFGRTFSHAGIAVGDGQIVHAYLGRGCVLARLDEGDFAGRACKGYTLFDTPAGR